VLADTVLSTVTAKRTINPATTTTYGRNRRIRIPSLAVARVRGEVSFLDLDLTLAIQGKKIPSSFVDKTPI
jgi:hypothetical protein